MINDISHPKDFAINGIEIGAASAPTVAPALKILVENALSFLGKYSAVVLIAAGKFPASPIAKTKRAKINKLTLTLITIPVSLTVLITSFAPSKPTNQFPVIIPDVAIPQKACKHAPMDQIPIAHKKPFLVSNQSTNLPAKSNDTA
ncbi:hypothetical protein D3C84_803390 [compost metagenome]